MLSGEWHPFFEPPLLESLVEATPEWLAILLVPLTHIGSIYFVVPTVIVFYLWDPDRFASWLGAVFGYYGLMAGIKSLNSAERPDMYGAVGSEWFPGILGWLHSHGANITTTSFPSGNAMVATMVVALMVVDLRISTLRRRAAVGTVVVLVVGYSRMALAVHYPIDIIGGILLGVSLAGAVLFCRRFFTREKQAVFLLAALLAFFGVWVRSQGFAVPTWDGILGSNRNVALGGAVGSLIVWHLGQATEWRFGGYLSEVGLLGMLLAIFGAAYLVHTSITHPLVTMAYYAVAFGAIVALPHVLPSRTQIETAAGLTAT